LGIHKSTLLLSFLIFLHLLRGLPIVTLQLIGPEII
jgi:hypothetical protein